MKRFTFNKKDFRLIGFASVIAFLIIGICQLYLFTIKRKHQQLVSQPLATATKTFRKAVLGCDEILFYDRMADSASPSELMGPDAWSHPLNVLRGQDAKDFISTLHFNNVIPSGWIMDNKDPQGRKWWMGEPGNTYVMPGLLFRKNQQLVAALNISPSSVRWYGANKKWMGEGQLSEQSSEHALTFFEHTRLDPYL